MKAVYMTAMVAVAGVFIGIAGTRAIDAQSPKAPLGYVIAEQDITDPAAAQKFTACNTPTMAAFHPQALVRGGKVDVIDGTPPKRIIVNVFDSAAAARAWVDSPAHKACDPLQDAAMHERAFILEGVATP